MIEDKYIAAKVLDQLEACNKLLNDSLFLVQDKVDKETYIEYRNLVGYAMGYLYTELVRPIHKKHPELEPQELKDGFE